MCGSVLVKNVIAVIFLQICSSQSLSRVPPKFEEKPLLLDSYIPATMQMLAYLTEQMKYNLKPTTTPPPFGPTTTPTMRPTPPHRPAVYAPDSPLGADTYYDSIRKGSTYRDYMQQDTGELNYFDRYKYFLSKESEQQNADLPRLLKNVQSHEVQNADSLDLTEKIAAYYGKNYIEFWKRVMQVEPDISSGPNDIDAQAQDFLKKYDDSDFRLVLLRQRQIPPTRAYVTLLSLYDLLNKESKRLGLSKYSGYTDRILRELVEGSKSTSSYQLRMVLHKVLDRDDTKTPEIVKKIKNLIVDIDDHNSYINLALRYIVPLTFAL